MQNGFLFIIKEPRFFVKILTEKLERGLTSGKTWDIINLFAN